MTTRLKRNLHYLRFLNNAKPKQANFVIDDANKDLLLCICEIVNNILEGNIKLKPKERNKLRKYKKTLHQLIDKRIKLKDKRKLIKNQKGGFLPAVIAPILGIAASLLGQLI